MPKIALLEISDDSYNHYTKQMLERYDAMLSDWAEVTEDEYSLLLKFSSENNEYVVVKQHDNATIRLVLEEELKKARALEEARKQKDTLTAKRKAASALKRKAKNEETEKKLFEKLKEKFGQNTS